MKRTIVVLSLLLPNAAVAQQMPTPSQTAIQIDNIINGWAQTIEAQQKVIADFQKEVADLKAKCGDPCKDK